MHIKRNSLLKNYHHLVFSKHMTMNVCYLENKTLYSQFSFKLAHITFWSKKTLGLTSMMQNAQCFHKKKNWQFEWSIPLTTLTLNDFHGHTNTCPKYGLIKSISHRVKHVNEFLTLSKWLKDVRYSWSCSWLMPLASRVRIWFSISLMVRAIVVRSCSQPTRRCFREEKGNGKTVKKQMWIAKQT